MRNKVSRIALNLLETCLLVTMSVFNVLVHPQAVQVPPMERESNFFKEFVMQKNKLSDKRSSKTTINIIRILIIVAGVIMALLAKVLSRTIKKQINGVKLTSPPIDVIPSSQISSNEDKHVTDVPLTNSVSRHSS